MGLCLAKKYLLIADSENNRIIAVNIKTGNPILFAGNDDCSPGTIMGKFDFIEEIISDKKGKILYTGEYNNPREMMYKGRHWYYIAGRLYGKEVIEPEEKEEKVIAGEISASSPIVFNDRIKLFLPDNIYSFGNHVTTLYFIWYFSGNYGKNVDIIAETRWGVDDKNVHQRSDNGYLLKLTPEQYILNCDGTIDISLPPYLSPKPAEPEDEIVKM
jgi:hypothetical protein